MARIKGDASFSGNFEVQKAAPLDARLVVETRAELTIPGTWLAHDGIEYTYKGMTVTVRSDANPENNTMYILIDDDYTVESNWEKIAESGHTHPTSEIVDFDVDVASNEAVTANTAKVTNADHTGHVHGDTSLTIQSDVVAENMLTPALRNKLNGLPTTNKLDATVDPTVNNDIDEGYEPGSLWINLTNDKAFRCLDNTDGNAIWIETTNLTVSDVEGMIAIYNTTHGIQDNAEENLDGTATVALLDTELGDTTWRTGGVPETVSFDGIYTTPSGSVSGTTIQEWIDLHFISADPNIQISSTEGFGLYEIGYDIVNPTINGNATLGSNPSGTLILMEWFRGTEAGTSIGTLNNPTPSSLHGKVDSGFTVSADQQYTVKITDDEARTDISNNWFRFVYPIFATTTTITTYTSQSLVSGNTITFTVVAEDNINKQKFSLPTSYTMSSVSFYNTVSSSWDQLDNSLWSTSSTTRTVQGESVNYTNFVHNGSKTGQRQLRVAFTK